MLLNQSGGDKNTIEVIKSEKAVFPFSTEGRMLAYLLATQTIDYKKYMELHNEYAKENISSIYPDFDGEFDLWLDGIRVEVKACRANSTKTGGSLASRAYLHSETTTNGFKYHYQQLKPFLVDEKDVLNAVRRKGQL
ncbi:hypothetical protein SAMN02910369_00194 [Lachnospiraceae bacterium NE2001]|nr:hypothetical protein SAMN02910369_00194 [Lachnospiraceae bacterium NE2001]